jgi:hypothetical protein
MISGVDDISERRTAYTLSWDLGSRYTGLLGDIYGPARAFLVCPRCEFAAFRLFHSGNASGYLLLGS